ncbi:MAG: leucyl aminopeptidase [Flavobacteriaceae bacterium]
MAGLPKISFIAEKVPDSGTVVVSVGEGGALGPMAKALDKATGGALARAIKVSGFNGKTGKSCEILAPAKGGLDRIVLVGISDEDAGTALGMSKLGGRLAAAFGKAREVTIVAENKKEALDAGSLAAIAGGIKLRSYSFDRYKTKHDDDDNGAKKDKAVAVAILAARPAEARKAWAAAEAVADGAIIARDLVNEPPNVLGPVEFAERCRELEKLGVEVEILTEKEMTKLKMKALLGVNQGSSRPPRFVVMRWNGGKAKAKPLAFVGKGVVFDTGGISIKPAGGMEDMKGDMGGAACVTGLMHALAARKAKVNAVGVIGLVENMPDGNAQRPGDIVTSMSGQTIEIINTDAEGRLVLADALWYTKEKLDPAFMINLATLTGAILVALGHHHAGIFSNDDELAGRLTEAGLTTGEKVWRLPLGPEYDKLINSKFADMKNTGGRDAGSITAAQFLKRFVGEVPWVHIDVAGTAMGSPQDDINRSWASGYGVRLLNQLVADHYEG